MLSLDIDADKFKLNFRFYLNKKGKIPYLDITSKIAEDPDLWIAYKSCIAMAFKDEYRNYKTNLNKKSMNLNDIHNVANNAADNFLILWTS